MKFFKSFYHTFKILIGKNSSYVYLEIMSHFSISFGLKYFSIYIIVKVLSLKPKK